MTTSRRSRRFTWLAVLLLAAAGVFLYFKAGAAKDSTGPRFDTTQADRGPLIAKITASGTLSALVTVQVGSQVSGRIQDILVDFNSPVKKGQVIARIDPQLFIAAREQALANAAAARASVLRSQAQAEEADRQYERAQRLASQQLVAQADAETAHANALAARAQVTASEAAVQQAAATLRQADVNLQYTTIVSPINGVVISRSVDVGQTVAASLQAPTLFVIAEDLRKMQVDASVSEADVGKLSPAMNASFTVDAYPGKHFSGKIRQIRNAAQTLQNVVTYTSVIDVDNPELELRPGMTASVVFVYADRDDVLRAPNAALRFRPTPEVLAQLHGADPGAVRAGPFGARKPRTTGTPRTEGRPFPEGSPHAEGSANPRTEDPSRRTLWVLRGGRPQAVPIRIGVSDGTLTEVLDGDLQPGELLITDVSAGAGPGGAGMRPPGFGGPGGRSFRMF